MRIAVIGCGYVGLVTGSCLAEIGHTVMCTDNDESKIQTLKSGKSPIYESHLDKIMLRNQQENRLAFTIDIGEAIRAGEVIFICVGTPPLDTGDADLSAIDRVARSIATESRTPKIVVEKSTVPVQTGQQLKRAMAAYSRNIGLNFRVVSNPEFLREGTAVLDFLHPERIVVGVDEESAERQLRDVYRPILEMTFHCPIHQPQCPTAARPSFILTTVNSAELIKHASNSYLAIKISYANFISDMCERLGANVQEVTHAMGLDSRIGPKFLHAGLGFGGFCLPKDIQAFMRLAERADLDFGLLKEAQHINEGRVARFLEKARSALWVLREKRIGILGLAFKSNTDDIRFSPALELVRRLLTEGAEVQAFDPEAMGRTKALYPAVHFENDPYEAAQGTDAIMIATEWPQFRHLDWKRIGASMARPLVLDGRNLLDPIQMKVLGFEYHCFGCPD
jgi:UDPglucose 6-dehydrogenase